MDEQAGTSGAGTTRARTRKARRRVPMWVYVAVGVLVVALALVTALVLSNRGGSVVPEAEVVTLPVPTPTVSAITRETGTAFYDALPSTVLAYAMDESTAAPELGTLGAYEGYRLGYTDGSSTVTLLAGQWEDAAKATAAYAALSGTGAGATASATPSADASATPSATSAATTSGDVTAGGAVVGSWSMTTNADGTGVLTWSNSTVVLQLSGPAGALHDLYEAFPL